MVDFRFIGRGLYVPGLDWEQSFNSVWKNAELYLIPKNIPEKHVAKTEFYWGWELASDPSLVAPPVDPAALPPTPLTDTELNAVAAKWENIFTSGEMEQPMETLGEAQQTILQLVAEIRRLRANDDGAVTKGT